MAGIIHIYCGEGKGKTTCSVGLSVRACGAGHRVRFVQFLKNGTSSEICSLKKLGVEVFSDCSCRGFYSFLSEEGQAEERESCTKLLDCAFKDVDSVDLLILDEVVSACECGALEEKLLTEYLDGCNDNTEIVLTGRHPSENLIKYADYMTEMTKHRHPYDKGVPARKGIEY